MKLFLQTLLLLVMTASAGQVVAHNDHYVIDEQKAIEIAGNIVQRMTFRDMGYAAGKLDASWKAIQTSDISIVDAKDGVYLLQVTQSEIKESLSLRIAFNGRVLEAAFVSAN